MRLKEIKRIALIGNPNSGKSSLFNQLTGLNQHVGNYPGVTVDKKEGFFRTEKGKVDVLDLPGIYSIFPKSDDERVVFDILSNPNHEDYPDLAVVVVDASNLERNLLLFTQIHDLKVPILIALNMIDVSDKEGIEINYEKLSELMSGTPVVPINARKGVGIEQLKEALLKHEESPSGYFLESSLISGINPQESPSNKQFSLNEQEKISDTEKRYEKIKKILLFCTSRKEQSTSKKALGRKIDKIATHPVWGYGIFLLILYIIFQAIYVLAEIPMDLIDGLFLQISGWLNSSLPGGVLTNLIAEGIIPGVGGIVVFIPQIMLLFLFIGILEETGYMSRVVFIMDRIMRPFGLNGKSVVPLISGVACAIPAIMATRTISQWKDRLITIMVTPLMSCSARLPVYTLLIALVVPDSYVLGIINLQGLALLGMYLLGLFAALVAAIIFKLILKVKHQSFLIMELPAYKEPRWGNVALTLWEKIKVFVLEAGKVILAISIILWVLASFGPGDRMEEAANKVKKPDTESEAAMEKYENTVASVKLENSWIGILGKSIEPAIQPLGYNWQIGISLITSFAAREVFVGSLATIYSIGQDFEEGEGLIKRMGTEVNPETGRKVYNLASGFSLMVFYAFAMQCMSTLAIVLRETKSWKWPLLQLIYMSALAYIGAFITYQILK